MYGVLFGDHHHMMVMVNTLFWEEMLFYTSQWASRQTRAGSLQKMVCQSV